MHVAGDRLAVVMYTYVPCRLQSVKYVMKCDVFSVVGKIVRVVTDRHAVANSNDVSVRLGYTESLKRMPAVTEFAHLEI